MQTSLPDADAMIVLASEQLWPNLQGLVHWADRLKLLCICEGEPRVAETAGRLENLCRALYPHIEVQRATVPEAAPEAAAKQIETWLQQFAGRSWIINASGGSRLMFVGVLPFAARPGVAVIHREGAQPWSMLRAQLSGVTPDPFDLPREETDRIPVRTLVEHVWKGPGEKVEFDVERPRLDVLRLTQQGIQDRWDWPKVMHALENTSESGALGFADFVAQVLIDLGVDNLATRARLVSTGGRAAQEIDIVANYRGQVLFLDCNLDSDEREKTTMVIRQAAQNRRLLAGLDARGLLLRPQRPIHPNLHALAEELSLRILDRDQAGRFFSQLADWAGTTLPANLTAAETALQEGLAKGIIDQVFVAPPQRPRRGREPRAAPPPSPRGGTVAAQPPPVRPREPASPSPAAPAVSAPAPLDPAYREKVKVKVLGPLDQGNLVGLYVQEEGKPRGILAYGIRPDQLPRADEVIDVYRNNLDPVAPQYRWDSKPETLPMPGRGRRRGRRG